MGAPRYAAEDRDVGDDDQQRHVDGRVHENDRQRVLRRQRNGCHVRMDKNQWMKIVAVVFEEVDVDDTLSKGLSKWIQNWLQSVAG